MPISFMITHENSWTSEKPAYHTSWQTIQSSKPHIIGRFIVFGIWYHSLLSYVIPYFLINGLNPISYFDIVDDITLACDILVFGRVYLADFLVLLFSVLQLIFIVLNIVAAFILRGIRFLPTYLKFVYDFIYDIIYWYLVRLLGSSCPMLELFKRLLVTFLRRTTEIVHHMSGRRRWSEWSRIWCRGRASA